MRKSLSTLFLLSSVLLAGCHEPPVDQVDPNAPTWELRGTFTENATQEDLADLRGRLGPYDAGLRVLESFPMQYQIQGLRADECPEAKEMVQDRPYVAETGDCDTVTPGTDGDAPTASPAA